MRTPDIARYCMGRQITRSGFHLASTRGITVGGGSRHLGSVDHLFSQTRENSRTCQPSHFTVMMIWLVVICGVLAGWAGTAVAATGPNWSLESSAAATYFRPGGAGTYDVLATNTGTTAIGTEGEPITIADTLPAGLTATSVELSAPGFPGFDVGPYLCASAPVRCEYPGALSVFGAKPIEPGQQLKMVVYVKVAGSVAEEPIVNHATVEGGGAQASASSQNAINSRSPFGIAKFTLVPTEETTEIQIGSDVQFVNQPYKVPFTQAGGHPWALTTDLEFATEEVTGEFGEKLRVPTREPKDVVVSLPPGLLGNPMAVPRCSLTQVTNSATQCPADTQIGFYRLHQFGGKELLAPIVNVVPEAGQSAEFALENTVKIDTPLLVARLVRTSEGYGFQVVSNAIPLIAVSFVETTFWGVPAAPSHLQMRGRICRRSQSSGPLTCEGGYQSSGISQVPFLTMPANCSAGPEMATVRADSWDQPGKVVEGKYSGYMEAHATIPAATGCNLLQFGPEISVTPETNVADEPTGLGVDLSVPLSETPESSATPQLKNSVLTLPEGVSVSPGVVDGIQACNEFGPEGIDITGPESEEVGPNGQLQLAAGHCPNASTVGTAEAITPFLPEPIKGHVYLARPGCGAPGQSPCTEQDALDGNLYRLYLELGGTGELAQTGVHFKVPLETEANPTTGQLTTVAVGTPQAPFSELKIHLNGGPRAALDTPASCGLAQTTADFTPWSAPGVTPEGLLTPGTPDATPSSFFKVEGCSNPEALSPGFVAGTVTPNAGKFSAFTLNLSRQDREQYIKGIQLHTPPGLLAKLSSVPLCPEAQANDPSAYGECTASKIGTTRVASGAGSHPFEIEGNVYLTGPHDGAPFGLSIVTHAVAGPFNLGLVVVRARIDIDPQDSTAKITTDETGPYAIPQIIFGVPLRLQRITVNIDRPGFMFNPTSCRAQQITASISGSQGGVARVTSPFAVGACKSLSFKPKFTVSTNGHTNRRNGASLDAKVSYPKGAMGIDANIARVRVSLPRQLPSRLTTLQKACLAATFAADPAACPKASIVGIARSTTPLLSAPLSGPVYFVSHGGEAFPNLVVVLEGQGVRVDLVGDTFINKAGITSSTFNAVPDVPVNSFELYLPQGRFSALAATSNLCRAGTKLEMPTEFVAQSGLVLKQDTKIGVTGCAKPRAAQPIRRVKVFRSSRREKPYGSKLRHETGGAR